ncbi:hypothetical protein JL49_24490 [Pseudoalteromonas luteoviolacea]|nr:hypothetical protein JL49_24490 [Pseudoalteromonas luteoviolacea]
MQQSLNTQKNHYHCYGIIYDNSNRVLICKRNIIRTRHGEGPLVPHLIKNAGQYTFAGGKLYLGPKIDRYIQQGIPVPRTLQIQIFHALEEVYSELGIDALPNNKVDSLCIKHTSNGYKAQAVYAFVRVSLEQMDAIVLKSNNAITNNQVRDDEISLVEATTLDETYIRMTQRVELNETEKDKVRKFIHTMDEDAKNKGNALLEGSAVLKNGWHLLAIKHLAKLMGVEMTNPINLEAIQEQEFADLKSQELPEITFFVDVRTSFEDPIPTLDITNEYALSLDADL